MAQSVASVSITYADSVVPFGSPVPASVTVSVSGPTPATQNVPAGTTSVTFSSLFAGDYTVTAQALDASNAPVGALVSGSFSVVGDPQTITISLPSALSVSVS